MFEYTQRRHPMFEVTLGLHIKNDLLRKSFGELLDYVPELLKTAALINW